MSLSFERFGGAWYSERSATHRIAGNAAVMSVPYRERSSTRPSA